MSGSCARYAHWFDADGEARPAVIIKEPALRSRYRKNMVNQ
jgi:hypothetical protein